MLDDQHEKDMMRNQVLAIAIVSVLFLVWYTFFIPQPPPPRPLPAQTTTADGGQPNYDGIGSDGIGSDGIGSDGIGSTATARPTSPG
ncbi:MAG: hypothetical protein IIB38_08790, partial [Candidatus Hydrogenedentes bacterium]|nr:hypothetical protein [Candidatus Hydrogenedentota bacterium]